MILGHKETESYDAPLIRALLTKDNYVQYISYVKWDRISREAKTILTYLGELYRINAGLESITLETLRTLFIQGNRTLSQKEIDLYNIFFDAMTNIPEQDVTMVIASLQCQDTRQKLERLLDTGRIDTEKMIAILEYHENNYVMRQEAETATWSARELYPTVIPEGALHWRLDFLNRYMGPPSKGMFTVVAAYVDVGKTAFVIGEVAHLVQQLKGEDRILWFNNEESETKVRKKLMTSVTGVNQLEFAKNPEYYEKMYIEMLNGDKDRIKYYDSHQYTFKQIENIIKKEKPTLVVFDILEGIATPHIPKMGADTERDKAVYAEFRRLSNENCMVIGITHTPAPRRDSDGNVIYEKWPDITQLAGSRVGKQAKADFMIMIGCEEVLSGVRYLHLAKAKNDHKGAKAQVGFIQNLFRYEDTK